MLKDYLVTAVDDLEVTYQNVMLGVGGGGERERVRSIGVIPVNNGGTNRRLC